MRFFCQQKTRGERNLSILECFSGSFLCALAPRKAGLPRKNDEASVTFFLLSFFCFSKMPKNIIVSRSEKSFKVRHRSFSYFVEGRGFGFLLLGAIKTLSLSVKATASNHGARKSSPKPNKLWVSGQCPHKSEFEQIGPQTHNFPSFGLSSIARTNFLLVRICVTLPLALCTSVESSVLAF